MQVQATSQSGDEPDIQTILHQLNDRQLGQDLCERAYKKFGNQVRWHDIKDCYGKVLVRVVARSRGKRPPIRDLRSFLKTALNRAIFDLLRSRRTRFVSLVESAIGADPKEPSSILELLIIREQQARWAAILAKIGDPKMREAIDRVIMGGESVAKVIAELGIAHSSYYDARDRVLIAAKAILD